MSGMTTKHPVKSAARENLPPGDPLSVVSICLDKETWGTLKLFADSAPLVRLDRHLGEYRVDDHESKEFMPRLLRRRSSRFPLSPSLT